MPYIADILAIRDLVAALEAEEIGGQLLEYFNSIDDQKRLCNMMTLTWISGEHPVAHLPPLRARPTLGDS